MLFDTITLSEGTQFSNLAVASGTSFPNIPNPGNGELFYRSDLSLLYYYNGSSWAIVGTGLPNTGDPYYNQTSLLLNFNGANGATTATDFSVRRNSITFGPTASISTAQSKFGGASAYFTGAANNQIATSASVVQGSGLDLSNGRPDWTIEAWAYPTSLPPAPPDNDVYIGMVLAWAGGWGVSYTSLSLRILWNGQWQAGYNTNNGPDGDFTFNGGPVTLNAWTHLALTRSGNGVRFFVNGVQTAISTITGAPYFPNSVWCIGRSGHRDDFKFYGYIDDVRITKGIARYTASFTPPTVAHPTFFQSIS